MKLIVGLGNPGAKYAGTRHNVGFEVAAHLIDRCGRAKPKIRFEAETFEVSIGDQRALVVLPSTYMNESGRSVAAAQRFYDSPLSDLMVICDDMNLPVGKLRMRPAGSAGGQKGLSSIGNHLKTNDWSRLRIGIGRPDGGGDQVVDYVLGRYNADDRLTIDIAIRYAVDAIETWATRGVEAAMNQVNAPAP